MILPFFIRPQKSPARGQVQFCYNLTVNLFEKGNIPFLEVRKKRQILDHYLKDICNITSHYGIFTIEVVSPKPNQITHQKQTDDIDVETSIVFTDYIKNIQHQNSQRANSIFTNHYFLIIYSYLSIIELEETQSESTTQTSRHSTARQEISIFSKLLNTILENLTCSEISKIVKHDLQKILAWFIFDYFVRNIDLIALSRKIFDHKVHTMKLF